MLYEKYRPQNFQEFIGNDKAKAVVQALCNESLATDAGLVLWIDGASGTGKTTLANLAAKALNVNQLDRFEFAGDRFDHEQAKRMDELFNYGTFSGGFRAFIINEAHAITPKAVQALLIMLEKVPKRTLVAFTTTEKSMFGAFDGPLLSRCIRIGLTNQGLAKPFAQRALEIAESEGKGGINEAKALRIVQDEKNNFRAVLARIQAFEFAEALPA